ncbi:MAG: TetR/AcrR family transcriptional regulator [Deltaproteobacteria bacterium]|nr:TetR/AcrR family transcriptional regulator [Deltaproteobacteria bacterium]
MAQLTNWLVKLIRWSKMAQQPLPETQYPTPAEERILSAATREFADKGFFGARTQAIADAAGVNKAMLHYYFRSKENLYAQVLRSSISRILSQVGRSWTGAGSLETKVSLVIDAYLDGYAANPGIVRIFLREVADGGVRFRRLVKEIVPPDLADQGISPAIILAAVGRQLNLPPRQIMHYLVNLVGMCLISFISPIVLETVLQEDLTDFNAYLEERRQSIKNVALTFLQSKGLLDSSLD